MPMVGCLAAATYLPVQPCMQPCKTSRLSLDHSRQFFFSCHLIHLELSASMPFASLRKSQSSPLKGRSLRHIAGGLGSPHDGSSSPKSKMIANEKES